MEATDIELINQCLDGEQRAFEVLVDRYKKLVYSVVIKMINNKEDVYDISQEVFIKVYKSLDKYNPEFKFSTWIVRITTNHCLDILRKKQPQMVALDNVCELSRKSDTPENRYIVREERLELLRAVDELPEKYRTPIVLFHRQGLSYDEITSVIGEPLTIVKNRLYRARQMLKERLLLAREEGK